MLKAYPALVPHLEKARMDAAGNKPLEAACVRSMYVHLYSEAPANV